MARRKFPSDGRPWFRCLTDILHDPKLNGDCPVDVAWFYIRLLAMLKTTGSKDGSISLDHRALNLCACREQRRHALRVARAGALRNLYTLSVEGVQTLIAVPNWPIIQGIAPTESVPRGEERRGDKSREEEGQEQAASPLPEPKPTDALQTAKSTFDPLPRYLEARESATAAKPTLWRAANQLGRKHYPGSKAEKLAWLYESEDVIVATAVGEVLKAGPMSEMAFNAKVLELMHRYYQHQFVERKPRPPRFESFEQAKRREGDDFWKKLKANGYRWAET